MTEEDDGVAVRDRRGDLSGSTRDSPRSDRVTDADGGPFVRAPESWTGPVPADEAEGRGYWEALRRHELSIQRCQACRAWHHPPLIACPECGGSELSFEPVSGRGTIYSFTVCHREFGAGLGMPFIGAHITLEEGPRVGTNLIECRADEPAIDRAVQVSYRDYEDADLTLAFFTLADA